MNCKEAKADGGFAVNPAEQIAVDLGATSEECVDAAGYGVWEDAAVLDAINTVETAHANGLLDTSIQACEGDRPCDFGGDPDQVSRTACSSCLICGGKMMYRGNVDAYVCCGVGCGFQRKTSVAGEIAVRKELNGCESCSRRYF